jgi:hypothetical protein
MRRGVVIVLLLAGCDGVFDLVHVESAGVDPCSAMTTAPATIRLTGSLLDSATNMAIASATVDAEPGGTAMTDPAGSFAIDVPTGGTPLFASLTVTGATASGHPPTAIYYQRPFTESTSDASSKLLSYATLDQLYGHVPNPANGTALISLRDCAGNGIAGAQVELAPAAGQVIYQGGGSTTDGTGVAYALDVPVVTGGAVVHAGAAESFTFQPLDGAMAIVYLVAP